MYVLLLQLIWLSNEELCYWNPFSCAVTTIIARRTPVNQSESSIQQPCGITTKQSPWHPVGGDISFLCSKGKRKHLESYENGRSGRAPKTEGK